MRRVLLGLTLGALVAAGQAAAESTTFSGVKLVDMKARTPERTVTLSFGAESLQLVDPARKNAVLEAFAYRDLMVTHTVSSAPPPSAGNADAAATQRASLPMYMGKTPRNWLTLQSAGGQATLRVSAKVYEQVKAALERHRVMVHER